MEDRSSCADWEEKLALRSEDLSPADRAALEAHVAACPSCAAMQANYEKLIARLRALSSPQITPLPHLPAQPLLIEEAASDEVEELVGALPASGPLQREQGDRHPIRPLRRSVEHALTGLLIASLLLAFLGLFRIHHQGQQTTASPTSTHPAITSSPSQGTKPATPTSDILLTAEAGPLLYHDVLNSSSTQKEDWQSSGTNGSRCFFASDGYHVLITTAPEAICHQVRNSSYQDIAITVDMALDGGGSGGLLFRDQATLGGNGAYFFEVSASGKYKISIVSLNKVLLTWTSSSVIRQGNKSWNRLQVIASGHLLLFYINGVYLTSIIDGTFSDGGISLACFNSGSAIFSNLYVYRYG